MSNPIIGPSQRNQSNKTGNGKPSTLAAGDFNGDNRSDLAITIGNNVAILLGNGTFRAPINFAAAEGANHQPG